MIKIILTLILLFCLKTFSAEQTLVIEIGHDYLIKNIHSKLWIENSNLIKAEVADTGVNLKALNLGRSTVISGTNQWQVYTVPLGFKNSFEKWNKLSLQFANIKTDFCDQAICLKGKISSLVEFNKIMRLIEETHSPIYLSLALSQNLENQIKKWYLNLFRLNNLPPYKVILNNLWQIQTTDKISTQDKNFLEKKGLFVKENKKILAIEDNIKVEIQVAEVKKEFMQEIGIEWPNTYKAQLVHSIDDLNLKLNASERNGQMKILASPNLICRNGKSAEFFAGGEFPIVTKDSRLQKIVVWKKYGIELKIKPQIDPLGQMSIELETEISSIDKTKEIDGIPALHTNRVTSFFDLKESKTIALSGLIQNEQGSARSGLPALGTIPILGALFSSENYLENKTELVIFVTPQRMDP